jgi:hypothetical protein
MSSIPCRVQYTKIVDGRLCFVIVDRHPGAAAEFWEQETGEVRWYPFSPTAQERSAAMALFEAPPAVGGPRWPALRWDAIRAGSEMGSATRGSPIT